ncbi:MAG TPA: hypothetical protein VGL64_04305 [Amycolatopsis sp.]|jgi:hypothetical protein|uniref:Uncharacterized protein n=1 Tax=Amycolatopsis saalfeldensis TaxID=394193 RepID=A0A1H8WDQ6_9PSEU|nr:MULTISPECIES: hypothetical protein [Amycolatopsis]SEP25751.1 hypothetical protein SAMN04489732_105101 [Amycolatopsis saalfeldensis]
MNTEETTVAAEELTRGQWFWHEPAPGLKSWQLQVAEAELTADAVRIITTDDVRELVSYRRTRRVRLAMAS